MQFRLQTPRLQTLLQYCGWISLCLIYGYYVSIFYPGYYTADSVYTLYMGLGLAPISNWHPPLLSFIWGAIYTSFGRADFIWLVQIALFFGFVAYWVRGYRSTITSALAALVLLGWPPLMTNMGAVWKDNWAIIAMLGAVAFTKAAWEDKQIGLAAAALVMAALTATLRIDYIIVVLPLILALGWRFGSGRLSWVAGFGALALTLNACALFAQSQFVTKRLNPWLTAAVWDIAGTIAWSSNPIRSVEVNGRVFTADQLKNLYSCRTSDPIAFGENSFPLNLPEGRPVRDVDEEARELGRLWLTTVTGDIGGYLRHRRCVITQFLGIGVTQVNFPYPFGITPNKLGLEFHRSTNNIAIYRFFDRNADGPMWRLWIYLAFTAAVSSVIMLARRDRVLALAIALTVLAAASRVLVLPAPDFRYGLWIVVGTWLVVFELLDGILTRQHRATRDAAALH